MEYVTDERGKRAKVTLDIEEYEQSSETIWDAEDARIAHGNSPSWSVARPGACPGGRDRRLRSVPATYEGSELVDLDGRHEGLTQDCLKRS